MDDKTWVALVVVSTLVLAAFGAVGLLLAGPEHRREVRHRDDRTGRGDRRPCSAANR